MVNLKKIGLFVLLLISVEIAAHIILPISRLNKLDAVLEVIKRDRLLVWRQKPNIKTVFQGVSLVTNSLGLRNIEVGREKKPGEIRIICLGDSATFGWGVDAGDTYPFLCQQYFKRSANRQNVEIINAGQIGYSTYQGRLFLKKYLLEYKPDLVIVSFLLNDIDRYRFYRNGGQSDAELESHNDYSLFGLSELMSEMRIFTVLKYCADSLINNNSRLDSAILKRQYSLSKIRVNPVEYRKNLEDIFAICKSNKAQVIFVKPPVNLSLPAFSESETVLLKNGYSLSRFYFGLGCKSEKKGDYEKACFYFKKAREYLVVDCSMDAKIYQDIIEKVARANNVPLLDVPFIFANSQEGSRLFNGSGDQIHPSAKGHELIAGELYRIICKTIEDK